MDFESIVRISAFGHNQSGKTGQNRPAVFHFSLLFVVGRVAAAAPSRPLLPLAVQRSHPSSQKAFSACVKRLPRILRGKSTKNTTFRPKKSYVLATFGPQKSYIGHLLCPMAKQRIFGPFPIFFCSPAQFQVGRVLFLA
jgi:hypothetical protein